MSHKRETVAEYYAALARNAKLDPSPVHFVCIVCGVAKDSVVCPPDWYFDRKRAIEIGSFAGVFCPDCRPDVEHGR
jgi:hypothetical protein